MKVRLTLPAHDELEAIADYFLEQSPPAGAAIFAEIERLLALLGERPYLGRPTNREPVRRLTLPRYPYVIYYRINANTVEVLSIFHTSRRPKEEFGR